MPTASQRLARARALESLVRDIARDEILPRITPTENMADAGLQHYALARDIELAVVDGGRGFGTGRLLPAGPLGEPISRVGWVGAIGVNAEAGCPSADRAHSDVRGARESTSCAGGVYS